LPKKNFLLKSNSLSGSLYIIHISLDTNSVSNIISFIGKESSTSYNNLDKRVKVFNFILVFFSVKVNFVYIITFKCTKDTDLSAVNIIIEIIGKGDNNVY
jgi:hypothetical protein